MTIPAIRILIRVLGVVALAGLLASCAEEKAPDAAEIEIKGAPDAGQVELVKSIVSVFTTACAGLNRHWDAVESAVATINYPPDIRRDTRRGWRLEVRLVIKTRAEGFPARYAYASGQTLEYYIGVGRNSGVVSRQVPAQKLCRMAVSDPLRNRFDSFLAMPGLRNIDREAERMDVR